MKNMNTIPTQLPAKAVSDLLVWETMISVFSDFIAFLGELLGFLGDIRDFFGGGAAE